MLNKWINWFLQKRNFATILLIVFLTQFVWIEGNNISYLKVGIMALCPVLLLIHRPPINKAIIWGGVYYIYVVLTASFHPDTFRASTLIYLLMFILMYIVFYSFIHSERFSLDYFTKVVKWLIIAYGICLFLQQICIIFGIRFMPFLNLNKQFFLSLYKLPSLAIEPSHSARILGVLFYAYLKCNEFQYGYRIRLSTLFSKEHRFVTYAFLWSMLTMGSGTAFICLGVLSLYFMKGFQFLYAIPIFIAVYFTLNFFEVKQFNRALSTAQATMTGDAQEVREVDGSASARIAPMLNTLNMDFLERKNWVGEGCDTSLKYRHSNNRYMGEINDYGLIAFFLGLIFVFSCAIKPLSLGTIMFFAGIGGGTGNIPYAWGLLMLMTCIRYFFETYKTEQCKTELNS